jgi:transcriptional regulator GlxA family with amidase domain
VRRAEDYMASHAAEPLTVAMIASHTGVSVRSLYAGFQRYRGRSPMEHLRRLRMEHVRAALLSPSKPDTTVTEVALRWGFGHLGQFAADYRARFGELPSQTLKRSRG